MEAAKRTRERIVGGDQLVEQLSAVRRRPADLAARMAVETMGGTAATLAEHDNDTRELRRRVTSPGGMTARGLAALERGRVRAAFEEAVAAVVEGRS